jgi:hypothetical protein
MEISMVSVLIVENAGGGVTIAEMKVVRALDPAVVWRIVDRYCRVRHPGFRSRHKVSRAVLFSGHDSRRCLGV